ncbi:MAG: hypothetical protein JNL32_08500, partial [Candidatus Kapabacteria bacterium]|nr:hypothetical protein [Candidatus Kapabacteria bacterium]
MSHFVRYVVAFSASILFTLPVIAQKDCSLPPSGLIPLTDFEGQSYRGFIGGLYPDGMNTPPLAHSAALQAARHRIFRRDASGTPSQNGAIVFIGVGASNPRTEFNRLMQISDTFALRNPALKLVNSCIGGQGIQKMNSPTDNYWKQAQKTLDSMGLNAKQVQVVWVETDNTQTADTLFPRAPQSLMDDFRALFTTLKDLYPNLQIIYCSARTYSGYIKLADATAGRGLLHPRDYYNGWSIKWMIER